MILKDTATVPHPEPDEPSLDTQIPLLKEQTLNLMIKGGCTYSHPTIMWKLWWTSGTGPGFLQVLRLPLPIIIPPTTPYSSIVLNQRYTIQPLTASLYNKLQ
jgi:hypothetical protein